MIRWVLGGSRWVRDVSHAGVLEGEDEIDGDVWPVKGWLLLQTGGWCVSGEIEISKIEILLASAIACILYTLWHTIR